MLRCSSFYKICVLIRFKLHGLWLRSLGECKLNRLIYTILFILGITLSQCYAYNFSTPYSRYSDGESVSSVLKDFAKNNGMNAVISDKISGVISGRFENINPNTFLEGLRAAYGVRYYVADNTIYFFHENDWEQKILNVGTPQQAKTLASAISKSGSVPKELPLKQNGGMLVVQGPADYIARINTLAAVYSSTLDKKSVMRVFKLKHAKANDTQISSLNKTIVIPGVASILQKMVNGASIGSGGSVSSNRLTVAKLRGTGLAAVGNTEKSESSEAAGSGGNPPTFDDVSSGDDKGDSVNIMADTRLNAVIIKDAEYKMAYYEKVIRDIDVPVKLVELHAAIVDVDVSAAKELGMSWQANKSFGKWKAGTGVGDSSNLSWDGTSVITNATGGGVFSTVFNSTRTNFFSAINLLEENQQARTLGRPSVMTLDNVEASLENTTTRYVKVGGYQDVDLFKVESGTVLQVTPHIIEAQDGGRPFISMVVSVQSNQDSSDSTSSTDTDTVPPIKQTKINTQAVVREGQSLLLGGYYVEYNLDGSSGVPGLKNVPYLGKIFGTDSKDSYRRERMILITPRVMDLGEVQSMPGDLDSDEFAMSPTADNYLKRPVKKKDTSGCSSNRATQNN